MDVGSLPLITLHLILEAESLGEPGTHRLARLAGSEALGILHLPAFRLQTHSVTPGIQAYHIKHFTKELLPSPSIFSQMNTSRNMC